MKSFLTYALSVLHGGRVDISDMAERFLLATAGQRVSEGTVHAKSGGLFRSSFRLRRAAALSSVCIFAGGVGFLTGCAKPAMTTDPLTVSVALSKSSYKIGEAVVATVEIENHTREAVELIRFDHTVLDFVYAKKGAPARIHREPVYAASVRPERRKLLPGKSCSRSFLFTRLTAEEGEYALQVGFKYSASEESHMSRTIYSRLVPFTVVKEVALRRDPVNGLILKEQAAELARQWVKEKVTAVEPTLVPLQNSGLFAWVVIVTVEQADKRETKYALQVNAYTGKVTPLEVDASAAPGAMVAPADSLVVPASRERATGK